MAVSKRTKMIHEFELRSALREAAKKDDEFIPWKNANARGAGNAIRGAKRSATMKNKKKMAGGSSAALGNRELVEKFRKRQADWMAKRGKPEEAEARAKLDRVKAELTKRGMLGKKPGSGLTAKALKAVGEYDEGHRAGDKVSARDAEKFISMNRSGAAPPANAPKGTGPGQKALLERPGPAKTDPNRYGTREDAVLARQRLLDSRKNAKPVRPEVPKLTKSDVQWGLTDQRPKPMAREALRKGDIIKLDDSADEHYQVVMAPSKHPVSGELTVHLRSYSGADWVGADVSRLPEKIQVFGNAPQVFKPSNDRRGM